MGLATYRAGARRSIWGLGMSVKIALEEEVGDGEVDSFLDRLDRALTWSSYNGHPS